jgi:hypothetical protein
MTTVEALKNKGNESFKAGNLNEAIQYYAEAIQLERSGNNSSDILAVLFSNTSQAHIVSKK